MRVAKLEEISLFVRNGKSVKQSDSLGGKYRRVPFPSLSD